MDRPKRAWILALAAVLLAGAYFGARGPARAGSDHADFALIYGSARAWVEGENPYDLETVRGVWRSSGGDPGKLGEYRSDQDLLYPPSGFLLLSPVALAGARGAVWILTGLSALCALIAAAGASRLAGFAIREPAWWLVLAAMLALSPGHTAIAKGQTAFVVLAMIALAYVARAWKPGVAGEIVCGVLLGAASALKPQMGLAFLAFEAVHGRWASLLTGGATGAALLGLGGARLWLADVDWISAWRANIAAFRESGAGDPSVANPNRYQMQSLHYPFHTFVRSAWLVSGAVLFTCAGLAIWFWTLRRRAGAALPWLARRPTVDQPRVRPGPELIDVSMAAVLGLLFFYHRFYDSIVLIFPAALAISLVLRGRAREGGVLLVPLAVFLVPGASVLLLAGREGMVPAWLANSLVWEGVVMPHQPWALLAIAIMLIWLARLRLPEFGAPDAESDPAPQGA